jgi:hypothetical protein
MIAIPRGRYLGKRLGDPPESEAEHFIRCPACSGWIDCRDLGQVFELRVRCRTRHRISRNNRHAHNAPNRAVIGRLKDEYDLVIYDDRKAVDRIYEVGGIGTPPDVRWFWSMTLLVDSRAAIVTNGKVATLEEAKARFRESLAKAREHPCPGLNNAVLPHSPS